MGYLPSPLTACFIAIGLVIAIYARRTRKKGLYDQLSIPTNKTYLGEFEMCCLFSTYLLLTYHRVLTGFAHRNLAR